MNSHPTPQNTSQNISQLHGKFRCFRWYQSCFWWFPYSHLYTELISMLDYSQLHCMFLQWIWRLFMIPSDPVFWLCWNETKNRQGCSYRYHRHSFYKKQLRRYLLHWLCSPNPFILSLDQPSVNWSLCFPQHQWYYPIMVLPHTPKRSFAIHITTIYYEFQPWYFVQIG